MANPHDPLVVSTNDACLHQSDLETLKTGEWLGDNVLAFHAEWLESQGGQLDNSSSSSQLKMFPPSVVEVLCTLDEAGADEVGSVVPKPSERFIVLPVSDRYSPSSPGHASGGSHWSLLAVDSSNEVAFHLDSLGDANRSAANAVRASILKLTHQGSKPSKASAEPRKVDCLQMQANGSDCGIYVLFLSSLLHRRLSSASTKSHDLKDIVDSVCTDATPDRIDRFRHLYLEWVQTWGNMTHHQEHVEANQQIRTRFNSLFSDLGVE